MRKGSVTKRTTIILDEDERRYIDSLILEGKEPGIKPLISKMLDVYRRMTIHDWKFPGEYYFGVSRVAFINVEFVNILLQHVPKEEWREAGRKMGEAAKVCMEAAFNLRTIDRKSWTDVFERLRVQGFGEFYLRDKYFLIKNPFITNHEVLRGFLETLLGVGLDAKTATAPLVFEIVR